MKNFRKVIVSHTIVSGSERKQIKRKRHSRGRQRPLTAKEQSDKAIREIVEDMCSQPTRNVRKAARSKMSEQVDNWNMPNENIEEIIEQMTLLDEEIQFPISAYQIGSLLDHVVEQQQSAITANRQDLMVDVSNPGPNTESQQPVSAVPHATNRDRNECTVEKLCSAMETVPSKVFDALIGQVKLIRPKLLKERFLLTRQSLETVKHQNIFDETSYGEFADNAKLEFALYGGFVEKVVKHLVAVLGEMRNQYECLAQEQRRIVDPSTKEKEGQL